MFAVKQVVRLIESSMACFKTALAETCLFGSESNEEEGERKMPEKLRTNHSAGHRARGVVRITWSSKRVQYDPPSISVITTQNFS